MHTCKKGLAGTVAAGGWWQSHGGGGGNIWKGGCSPHTVKKIENASKNAPHFSIFVPLTGVQILLEASVLNISVISFRSLNYAIETSAYIKGLLQLVFFNFRRRKLKN